MPDGQPRALVTGASGFVGSHLVGLLVERGWKVRCLVRGTSSLRWVPRDSVELVEGDVGDSTPRGVTALRDAAAGVTNVFHLAAVTSTPRDSVYRRVNVDGTERLMDAVRDSAPDSHVVFCSSLSAAGPARGGHPVREGDPASPVSAYGRSKLAAERVMESSDLRHAVIRPPVVYGPREVDVLAGFRAAARGIAVRSGPRGQRLSFVHVADLVDGMVLAAERQATGVYYMSDGAIHRWEEVIAGIGEAVGRAPRIVEVPAVVLGTVAWANRAVANLTGRKPLLTPDRARELRAQDWSCDDGLARNELGYRSRVELVAGLRETALWYREQGWL